MAERRSMLMTWSSSFAQQVTVKKIGGSNCGRVEWRREKREEKSRAGMRSEEIR